MYLHMNSTYDYCIVGDHFTILQTLKPVNRKIRNTVMSSVKLHVTTAHLTLYLKWQKTPVKLRDHVEH